MLYADRIAPFCVISMFISALVRPLRLNFSDVLFFVAFHAKTHIYFILGLAFDFMTYFVSFLPRPVGEVGC